MLVGYFDIRQRFNPWDMGIYTNTCSNDNNPHHPPPRPLIQQEILYLPKIQNNAVFTLITTNDFTDAARTLVHSLIRAHVSAKFVAMILPGVDAHSECLLQSAGWDILRVQPIPAPKPPTLDRWKDMFTKLLLWNLTEYDKLVYLDSDTIVVDNFDEIFDSPAEFSAVGDINNRAFGFTFNAGMFVLKPNSNTFNQIMQDIYKTGSYDTGAAEQSFLNWWYAYKWLRLPYKYNANLAAYYDARAAWNSFGNIKIIHYTTRKPNQMDPNDETAEEIFKIYFRMYKEMLSVYKGTCL